MELPDLLALRVPADALGLTTERHAQVVNFAIARATTATEGVYDPELEAQAMEAHALAFLYGLEAEKWRRALSGSGPDGSVSVTEISTRMKAALDDQKAQLTLFEAIVPPATAPAAPSGPVRASGSVKITFEG